MAMASVRGVCECARASVSVSGTMHLIESFWPVLVAAFLIWKHLGEEIGLAFLVWALAAEAGSEAAERDLAARVGTIE